MRRPAAGFSQGAVILGIALGDAENYEDARACLTQVIEAESENAEAFNSLGYVASRLGEPDQAIDHYERAIELQPNYAQAHFNLGMNSAPDRKLRTGFC